MPTLEAFQKCPPFPSETPIADIPIISYSNLKSNTGPDSENLFEGCREQGFFLLDLRGDNDGEKLLKDAEGMFDLNAAMFALGHEELMKFKADIPKDLNGYKPPGLLKTDDGKRDTMGLYTLSRDEVLSRTSTRKDPELFETHRQQCKEFFLDSHKVVVELLKHLDKHLGLAPGTLSSLSPLDKPSATALRLLLAYPQPEINDNHINLGGHTDIGTLSMLFHVVGGLQILPAHKENIYANWRYIRPEPGCALINVADSLVEWTGGILRSSLHRVATPPGKQANVIRQAVGYFVRPEHNGSMKRLKSAVIPPLSDGEQEETRSVDEWAAWSAQQVVIGKLKPQTKGGRPAGFTKSV